MTKISMEPKTKITLYLFCSLLSVGAMTYFLFTLAGAHSKPLHLSAFAIFALMTGFMANRLGRVVDDYEHQLDNLNSLLTEKQKTLFLIIREAGKASTAREADADFPDESPILIESEW